MENDGKWWKMMENDGKWWKMMENDGKWWMNDGWMMDEWWMNRMENDGKHAELWSQFQRLQRIVLSQEQSLRNKIEECLSCTTSVCLRRSFTLPGLPSASSESEILLLKQSVWRWFPGCGEMPRTSFINERHRSRSTCFIGPCILCDWRLREDSPASKRSKHQASLNCVAPVLASALRLVPFGFQVVVLVPATGSSTDSDWQHRFFLPQEHLRETKLRHLQAREVLANSYLTADRARP